MQNDYENNAMEKLKDAEKENQVWILIINLQSF